MDWLHARQDAIEAELARRHLRGDDQRGAMAMFDLLPSSWVEGSCCPLAGRGYSRDGRKGTLQIEYGLLTDRVGRPVAIRVLPGNTADPAAFIEAVEVVRTKFRDRRADPGRGPRDDHLGADRGAPRSWVGCPGSPAWRGPGDQDPRPPRTGRCR